MYIVEIKKDIKIFKGVVRVYMVMMGEDGKKVKSQNGKKSEKKTGQKFKLFTENKKDRENIVDSIL